MKTETVFFEQPLDEEQTKLLVKRLVTVRGEIFRIVSGTETGKALGLVAPKEELELLLEGIPWKPKKK